MCYNKRVRRMNVHGRFIKGVFLLKNMIKFYKLTRESFKSLGVTTLKELWAKVKDNHDGLTADLEVKFVKKSETEFESIFSTGNRDRDGEIIHQNFELDNFKKNPVLLDSHRYDSLQRIIGRVDDIEVKDGKLQGTIIFAIDNPLGALAAKLAEKGFINATSIGFIPKEFDGMGDPIRSELLEISIVGVPANAEALLKEKKNKEKKDLDDAEEEDIDDEEEEDDDEDEEEDGDDEDDDEDKEDDEEESEEEEVNEGKMIKEVVAELNSERLEMLENVNEAVKSFVEISKGEKITDKEKSIINKSVRQLLNAKK